MRVRSWLREMPALAMIGVVLFGVLAIGGGLLLWGSNFADNMVHDQLSAQRITFPEKGAPNFSAKEFPGLQRYAGQAVDNGPKAKAYANEYIKVHLKEAGQGQTYSEVSGKVVGARAAGQTPDPKLVQLQDTLFRGETLRGLLLNVWGWSVMGEIAYWCSLGMFLAAGTILFALILGFVAHERSIKKGVDTVITATREAVTV
jgi:hypothetical protein